MPEKCKTKNSSPWGNEIYNFSKALVDHRYYMHLLSLSVSCPVEDSTF